MKKALFLLMTFAGASVFAQKTSDTTFIMVESREDERWISYAMEQSEEMFLVKDVLYVFYQKGRKMVGVPVEFPSPIIIYPKKQHVSRYSEYLESDRYKESLKETVK
jgi:hypothetical protein